MLKSFMLPCKDIQWNTLTHMHTHKISNKANNVKVNRKEEIMKPNLKILNKNKYNMAFMNRKL